MTSGLGGSDVRPPSSSSSPLLLEGELLLRSRGPSGEGGKETGVTGDKGAARVSMLVKHVLVGWQVSAELLSCVGSSARGKLSGTKAGNTEKGMSGGISLKWTDNQIKH